MITIQELVRAVILVIVLGLVFGLLFWLVKFCKLPEPFDRVAIIILAVAAVLVLIGILMQLAGHPLIVFN